MLKVYDSNTGKDDIIDFFGSLDTPSTVQQASFGGFDPFQQQRMMAEQEQQYMQQQMMMQQQESMQLARQIEYQRQQQMLQQQMAQQQMAQQQMAQQQMAQQQASFSSNPHNPFAAPPVAQLKPIIPESIDLASNPNAVLDPFASVSSKLVNPYVFHS